MFKVWRNGDVFRLEDLSGTWPAFCQGRTFQKLIIENFYKITQNLNNYSFQSRMIYMKTTLDYDSDIKVNIPHWDYHHCSPWDIHHHHHLHHHRHHSPCNTDCDGAISTLWRDWHPARCWAKLRLSEIMELSDIFGLYWILWAFQTSADVTVHDIIGTFWRGGVNTGSNIIRGKLGTRPTTTLGTKQWRVHSPPCLPPQREAYGQCCQIHRGLHLKMIKIIKKSFFF